MLFFLASRSIGSTVDLGFDMVRGSNMVEVTAESIIIFVLLKKNGLWSYSTSSWENYMYALPLK